jgi:hypothetical protein
MRISYLFAAIIICIFFVSCNTDHPSQSPITSKENLLLRVNKSQVTTFHGGIWRGTTSNYSIQNYGPSGLGWRGILMAFDDQSTNWSNSMNSGYSPRIACLYKGGGDFYGTPSQGNFTNIYRQIDQAAQNHAEWIYIDDPITGQIVDGSHRIGDTTMIQIYNYAHNNYNMKVAVSENYIAFNNNGINTMNQRWTFYEWVDLIMPYGYNCSLSQLEIFYSWITTIRVKQIVPFLGYHVWVNGSLYNQLGGVGYIQQALDYTTSQYNLNQFIFYYVEGNSPGSINGMDPYFTELTNYLIYNGYY